MDYKDTLNLPKTGFQMKANLSKREPETIEAWEGDGLYGKIIEAGEKAPRGKYILHDGPPYANGHIHMGHVLNKTLKDLVVKSRFMMGFATDYVPGWDCHGLPIELQVERELGEKKKEMSKAEVRKRCRTYAEKFLDIQREEFKRLGVFGEWDNPYLTMDYSYQASILRELGRFREEGLVYKGKKPVHWCSSCSTALAEAEVEYAEKTSPSVYVKFRVKDPKGKFKVDPEKGAYFAIWTTTPWTLPANLAIAVHPELEYRLVKTPAGDLILAQELVKSCMEKFGFSEDDYELAEGAWTGAELEGVICSHPFVNRESPVYTADFVTTEAGTGCVHIAPGHGQDDYQLGLAHGLDVYAPVDSEGKFTDEFPEFSGEFVFKANKGIIGLLEEKGALLAREDTTHSYPHCWRCKNPIIFRATAQWFVSMEEKDLRKKALDAIENSVEWIPSWGKERIYNMIKNRPDWCLSRQRAWGVPIPAVRCTGCGTSELDPGFVERLADAFETEGADVWFEKPLGELPGGAELKCPECGGVELEKEEDILDVWFDSGVSFAAVLEKRDNLKFPADMYLEGSDQHRGWFHSSLLTAIGTRGEPPYKSVLTHGFVVDGQGRKMSKSLGNVVSPQKIIDRYGAEVLRLWVAAEDYREDIRISEEILKRLSEAYRRIRNTFRYILGNLSDFDPGKDRVELGDMTELDRLTLHKLTGLTEKVLGAYERFEFHSIYHSVHNFCAVDLSSFYLDILKDRLYTRKASSTERRAAQTVMYEVLDTLVRLLAPVLAFTTDEAWSFMPGREEKSVHLASFPEVREQWRDKALEEKWTRLLEVKTEISRALEGARNQKIIGHSLDARVTVHPPEALAGLVTEEKDALEEILIISQMEVSEEAGGGEEAAYTYESAEIKGLTVTVGKAAGDKCERCWHYSPSVGSDTGHPAVCDRCVEALS